MTAVQPAVQRMTRQLSEERATILAKDAIELARLGERDAASRKLREAAALAHDNPDVQSAFQDLHKQEGDSPLLAYCQRYALYHSEKAGEDAVSYLKGRGHALSASIAVQCFQLILDSKYNLLSAAQDTILAELVRQSPDVRAYVVAEMQTSTTKFFDNIYDRGDQSTNFLRTLVLDATAWPDEHSRLRVEDDLFQLLIARLMESGHDLDARALRGISMLLMADAPRLQEFVDDQGFDAFLSSLDIRLPLEIRGQATLVISKYLEVAEEAGRTFFSAYVTAHVSKAKPDDLILAFSAAAGLFRVAPAMTAPFFLTDGLLPSLLPLLDRKPLAHIVHDAFLALLNAACTDSGCRMAIKQHCSTWLSHMVSNGHDTQPAVAATVLAKLRAATSQQALASDSDASQENASQLISLFKKSVKRDAGKSTAEAIEGLAFASLAPATKESLAKDAGFLHDLLHVLQSSSRKADVVVGGLSVLTHLTQYLPHLSDEQKKMSQLKAYAHAAKPPQPNPLDDDAHVSARCTSVVNAGTVPVLVTLNKEPSLSSKQTIAKILLSLAKNAHDRGKLAQQGAIKLAISLSQSNSQSPTPSDAAHALARILISLDPSHVFPSGTTPHITSAVEPLVSLLRPRTGPTFDDQPRDLLPVFESLLALTNLASYPDLSAANTIIRLAWDDIEDLLLSNNAMIRRAACELTCNLTPSPMGAAKFADGTKRAGQRLHLLLALADVDDLATRRAAGGTLAMLSDHEPAVTSMLDVARAPEILTELCLDDDEGIQQRGKVCVQNMLSAGGNVGERARRAFQAAASTRMQGQANI